MFHIKSNGRTALVAGIFMLTQAFSAAAQEPLPKTPRALSPLETYNYVAGTQTIGAAYQFTSETKLVETARAILAMGSNTLKFSLAPEKGAAPKPKSLTELAQNDASVKNVFAMPFAHYLLWVSPQSAPGGGPFAPARREAEQREIYDLTRHLLTTYNGTGKTFYLGNWEGDWLLTHTNPDYVATPEEVQNMIDWAKTRQKAVDDARRDTPHTNVQVYYYIEVNRVMDAREGKVRVANKVLPAANPDFVSYSSYDAQRGDIEKTFAEALDYLQAQLTPKAGLPQKRVFIGEYGLPQLGHSAAQQNDLVRRVLRAGVRWGCPFVLYWEMYNNEVTPDGKQRGFWLIDDKNVKQPAYFTHEEFLKKAKAYVAEFNDKNRRLPNSTEFGAAALTWLPLETP